ncbi:MAG: hypothetical protein WCC17_03590 [Candidatus Nitrosopolaris sp.]
MSSAGIYYNYMRQPKSMLNIPDPQTQSQPQSLPSSAGAAIETVFRIRDNIINIITKRSRF